MAKSGVKAFSGHMETNFPKNPGVLPLIGDILAFGLNLADWQLACPEESSRYLCAWRRHGVAVGWLCPERGADCRDSWVGVRGFSSGSNAVDISGGRLESSPHVEQ